MALDTKVEGDPDSLNRTCDWLRDQEGKQHHSGDQVHGAGGASESGWTGQAAEGFRGVVTQLGTMIDSLTGDLSETCSGLQTHASDLAAVKGEMARAQQVARDGGLIVNGTIIEDPGPAPAAPAPSPTNWPSTPQDTQAHEAAAQAQDAFQRKAQAYAEASQIVEAARKKETESQNVLIRFLSGTLDPVKLGLTLGDISTGAAGAVAVRASNFKDIARSASTKASQAAHLADNTNMSLAGRTRAAAMQIEGEMAAKEATEKASATRASRVLGNMPDWAKTALDAKMVPDVAVQKAPNALLRGATKVGSKIPIVGTVFTGLGIGYDVSQGKSVAQASTSGASSLVAGSVVGTAIGGPVGTVVGGAVGVGVGFVVDEVWSWFD